MKGWRLSYFLATWNLLLTLTGLPELSTWQALHRLLLLLAMIKSGANMSGTTVPNRNYLQKDIAKLSLSTKKDPNWVSGGGTIGTCSEQLLCTAQMGGRRG